MFASGNRYLTTEPPSLEMVTCGGAAADDEDAEAAWSELRRRVVCVLPRLG